MNRTLKAVIVAAALIVVGAVLAGCGLWGMDGAWDLLSGSGKLITTQETITGEFTDIHIDINWADLELLPSPDGTCYYKAATYDNMFCSHRVENGTLKIRQDDNRKWHQHIGIYWEKTSLQVYLPEDVYGQLTIQSDTSDVTIPADFTFENVTITTDTGDLTITCQVTQQLNMTSTTGDMTVRGVAPQSVTAAATTGDVYMQDITCNDLSVSTSTGFCRILRADVTKSLSASSTTGDKYLADVQCGTLKLEATTGDSELRNVVVTGDARLESDTGDWELEGFDAANISIETSTGDVEGTLLSEKSFFTDTHTGDVEVPRTDSGGKCEITTDTGDIEIEIVP